MAGISAGTNGRLSYEDVRRMNYIPELVKAQCSIVGVWGPATADNKLYHLRALDWSVDAPMNKYPAVMIYEPSEPGASPTANIGYLGLIGSITGISKLGISVGEKILIDRDGTLWNPRPTTTYFGKPWTFVTRDTIMFSKNHNDVYNSLNSAPRTA